MLPNDWQTWRVFRLTTQQYEELQHRLEEDDELQGLYKDIVHYDWVPPCTSREGAKGSYILRKPSDLYVLFTARVQCARTKGIEALVVRLKEGGNERVARAVEMGYPPDGKNLSRLAKSYVVESWDKTRWHKTRCVVASDIPSSKTITIGKERRDREKRAEPKPATVSVWRPSITVNEDGEKVGTSRCDLDADDFRSASGEVCEDAFELTPPDLLPASIIAKLFPSASIND